MEFPEINTSYSHVNNFINELAPIVCNEFLRRKANGDKVISPAVVLAQAGKESGWNLNAPTLFGIKGDGVELNTSEFIDGEYVHIKDSFAAYPNIAGAVQGYYDLMQWDNYDDATSATTVEGELEGLTNDIGYAYATAPDYYETTLAIINDFGLRVYNDYVSAVESEETETTAAPDNQPGNEAAVYDNEQETGTAREWSREQALAVTDGLYHGLLFRGYDEQNEAIVHGLEYDMSRIEAFDSIRDSEEHKKKSLIVDCYLVMRGSLPSDEEVEFWFHQSEDEIKQGILYSEDFNNKYGV